MKTYLITGAAGFIGANFLKYILKKYEDINVIVVDALTYAGNLGTIKEELKDSRVKFEKVDIRDRKEIERIFSENKVDYVVNFAAESHVDRSIENPQIFLETNILGTQNLLDNAKKAWTVSKADPRSPYSASKTGADHIVIAYGETYKLPINITRCSNNYGPYHFPEKLIPLMIKNILEGKKLPVYGKGDNVRDWLYVEDHCKGIDLVLRNAKVGEVYNIGGFNEEENINIVKLVIDILKEEITNNDEYKKVLKTDISNVSYDLITYVQDRLGHDMRYAINPSKIAKELGWEVMANFRRLGDNLEENLVLKNDYYAINELGERKFQERNYKEALEYFDKMYEAGIKLIKKGKAFVCDLSADEIREYRGTLTEAGRNSPYRERSIEENLDLFERMKNGEFPDGSKVLRAKIDMTSPNMNMRDPVIYRILHSTHHRTGNTWCIY